MVLFLKLHLQKLEEDGLGGCGLALIGIFMLFKVKSRALREDCVITRKTHSDERS